MMPMDGLNIPDYHAVVAKRLLAISVYRELGDDKKAKESIISLIYFARGLRNGAAMPARNEFKHVRGMDEMEFIMGQELARAGLSPTQQIGGESLISQIKNKRRLESEQDTLSKA